MSGLENLSEAFPTLPVDCGRNVDVGVDETEEWRDWSTQETTPDQRRIEDYLLMLKVKGVSILHVGVGNSSLARRIHPRARHLVGTTISQVESDLGRTLAIPHYRVFIHNKYSGVPLPAGPGAFDIVVDNNISTFCCCLRHMVALMQFYASVLAPGGVVITDREGLNWVTSAPDANPRWKFDFDDLSLVGAQVGLNVYRATADTYLMSRESPTAYLLRPPSMARRAARLLKRTARRAVASLRGRMAPS